MSGPRETLPSPAKKDTLAPDTEAALDRVMSIEGAIACALVDHRAGMVLGTRSAGEAFDIELVAGAKSELIRIEMATSRALGLDARLEDMLTILEAQYHLIRPLPCSDSKFLYLVIDRARGNLALARHHLVAIERSWCPEPDDPPRSRSA